MGFGFYQIAVTIIRESWLGARKLVTSSYNLLKKYIRPCKTKMLVNH